MVIFITLPRGNKFSTRNDRKYWRRYILKCCACRLAHVKIALCKIHVKYGCWHCCIKVMYFPKPRGPRYFIWSMCCYWCFRQSDLCPWWFYQQGKRTFQECLVIWELLLRLKRLPPAVGGWRNWSSLMLLHMLHGNTHDSAERHGAPSRLVRRTDLLK